MNPILEPLTFPDRQVQEEVVTSTQCECLFCPEMFDLQSSNDQILAHFLLAHKLVVADVKEIVDLKRYIDYWRPKFRECGPKAYCFVMETENENREKEEYFMLAHELPEDQNLREKLQREKLNLVLKQQQKERKDDEFSHCCLFCRKIFTGNRKVLFDHMNFDHNFSVGLPDNVVFVEEFLNLLDEKLSQNICLYCEKTFKDRTVLKEHMRKKIHKKINPVNKEYDKFYLVNYLEPGKSWKEIMDEFDEYCQNEDWSDWFEPEAEAICLFCDFQSSAPEVLSQHITSHNFDFLGLKKNFSIYQQIKIVNYVRRQVHEKKCILCDEQCSSREDLSAHMQKLSHFKLPERSIWDQSQYYFPTYENDALLCLLEDTVQDDSIDADQVKVIPEETVLNLKLVEEELLKLELIVKI
ncbi:Zinc finger protein 277 [Daphnia magna]|uniref:Zinc finger protein 277 n=2 Tax=Daphnia magna TaxID=35525 RepID=A0A164ZBQ4_9CRUS|nr:hypothetical protein OUZ56_030978 [Daphnia magna]KZS16175.1 Zinc finger protein 277 [Daphnia magna]